MGFIKKFFLAIEWCCKARKGGRVLFIFYIFIKVCDLMTTRVRLTVCLFLAFTFTSAQMMNVRKWRKTERDSLDNALLLLDEKYFAQALPIFEDLLAHHPKEDFLKYSFAKCALHRPDRHSLAYDYLSEIYGKNKKLPDISYDMALAAHYNYKFDEAEQYVNEYLKGKRLKPDERTAAEKLVKNITYARFFFGRPTKTKIKNLGPAINSSGEEYVPAITADESMMIFSYSGEKSKGGRQNAYLQEDVNTGMFMEDIYMSEKKNGVFQPAVPLDSLNTTGPDAAISLSNDGNVLFVYRDIEDGGGDLYQSFLLGKDYSFPLRLEGKINSYAWDGHCSLSPDGQILYFSSEREGGFGGKDLYRASLGPDSVWTNIVNLGDSINTKEDEDAPFMFVDGRTLYYSSKGHNSMGGYDIFRSYMNVTDSSFKNVENLGYPLNSPSDDIYFILAANGRNGYYSTARKDGLGLKDIYLVEPNFSENVPAVLLVKGTTRFEGSNVSARAEVKLVKNNQVYGTFYSNSVTGKYLFTLPAGFIYEVVFTYSTLPSASISINTATLQVYSEKVHDVVFAPRKTVPAKASPTVAPVPLVDSDGFVPLSKLQAKTLRYIARYGDVQKPGLEFKVQITALKNTRRYYFPDLAKYGRIEKLELGDGFTRLMIGGSFATLRKAFVLNKKIVKKGYKDAFVVAFYNGKRVQYEELEKLQVFK
jgi:hypothetical protein